MLKPMLSSQFQQAAIRDAIGMTSRCLDLGQEVFSKLKPNMSTVKNVLRSVNQYYEHSIEIFEKRTHHYRGIVMMGPFVELLEAQHRAIKIPMQKVEYCAQYMDNLKDSVINIKSVNSLNFQNARTYLDDEGLAILADIDRETEKFTEAFLGCKKQVDFLYGLMSEASDWQNDIVLEDDERRISYSEDIEMTPYKSWVKENGDLLAGLARQSIQAMQHINAFELQAGQLASTYTRLVSKCSGYLYKDSNSFLGHLPQLLKP